MTLAEAPDRLPSTLAEHEAVIERGLQSFLDVGNALLAIKVNSLYREAGWERFEDYCRDRWEISRGRGYQLMTAAATFGRLVESMSTTVDTPTVLPTSERQTRPLASLPDERKAEAWTAAVDAAGGEQPTAAQVEAAVVEITDPAPTEPDQAPPHGIERPDPVDLLAALETSVINAAADTRIRAAIAEFPFLADYPTEDVLSTADALRAIPEGPQRDRRIEAAKTWPAAVAAADDINAAGVDPADELREVLTLVADASHALAGLSTPARDLITHMPPDEVDEWRQELKRAMSRLNALHIELNQPLALRRVK